MIRLAKSCIGDREKRAVDQVLDIALLGMGPQVKEFENEIRTYLGGDVYVACVNTGTAALHLALQALEIGPGDEVLVPTLTYVASFQAVSATGAIPIACDVERETGLIDLADAERRLSSRTRALMPVHYCGEVGDLSKTYEFAEKHRLRTIEDAAHAFGTAYQGRRIGSIGDVVCFSFDGIKNITAGEGGAVVTRDPKVHARVSDARLLSVQSDSEQRYRGERSWDFDVTEQGWRYHMSEIMAAIGRVQLSRLEPEFRPIRQKLVGHYRSRLAGLANVELFSHGPDSIPFMFPIKIRGDRRDSTRNQLLAAGIQVGIHYKPNHLLTKYRGNYSLPTAESLYPQLLTLPLHSELQISDIDFICDRVIQAVN